MTSVGSAGAEIEWMKLSLNNLPQLNQEVSNVSVFFESVKDSGDDELLEVLYRQISFRLDEMETFFLQHDTDPRAVLMEKQRLRLKKILQSDAGRAAGNSMSANYTSASVDHISSSLSPRSEFVANNLMSEFVTPTSSNTPKINTAASNVYAASQLPHQYKKRRSSTIPQDVNISQAVIGKHSTVKVLKSPTKRALKPIYAWERQDSGSNISVNINDEESASNEIDTTDPPAPPSESEYSNVSENKVVMLNLQVRITKEEYHQIMARQRIIQSAKKYKQFSQKASEKSGGTLKTSRFLLSQGPYQEDSVLFNTKYRSPDKSKWIDKRGFQRSSKKDFYKSKE